MHKVKHKYWKVKDMILIYKMGLMKSVLSFLRLSTNTSLGLFWTLVQVLLHTNLIQLSASCSLLLLGERVRPVGKIYTFICTCIRLWWRGENYHKTNSCWTHSSKHYYFLTEIIRVCDDKQNTILMVIVCTSKKIKLLNFTKQQGGVFKLIKTETNMISQVNTLIVIPLFN
jgi:hypothetical protein